MAFNSYAENMDMPRNGLLENPAFRMNPLSNYESDIERDQRLYAMAMEVQAREGREPSDKVINRADRATGERDRHRDRSRDHRDHRDRGRDRERRRQDSDRNRGDWSQEREGRRNRDRSPLRGHRQGKESEIRDYDGVNEYGRNNDDADRSLGSDGYHSRSDGLDRSGGSDGYHSRSESQDRSGGSDGYRGRQDQYDDRGGDKWVSEQPSRTLLLRGLNQKIDEKIIGAELKVLDLPVKDIRLIRRQSGYPISAEHVPSFGIIQRDPREVRRSQQG